MIINQLYLDITLVHDETGPSKGTMFEGVFLGVDDANFFRGRILQQAREDFGCMKMPLVQISRRCNVLNQSRHARVCVAHYRHLRNLIKFFEN